MKNKIKLMIVDDQRIFVESLAGLLNMYSDVEVINTAENGKIALEKMHLQEPDVLILDYEMPVMDGRETAKEVINRFPRVKIIILSMYDEDALIINLFEMGVHSFLPKNCDSQQLLRVIETVHKEGQYIPSNLEKRMENANANIGSLDKPLNHAEQNIIKLMCFGKRDKEIAESLDISINTLKFHKDNIRMKTGIITSAQFGVYGVKHKIVDLRDLRLK
jgi:DNA-binding NarL/FixJ family response regulator